MVRPRSPLIGQVVFPGMVTDSGDLVVLTAQRQGEDPATPELTLAAGDTLLLEGSWRALDQRLGPDEVLVVDPPEVVRRQAVPLGPGARRTLVVTAAFVAALVAGLPPAVAGIVAAAALVLLADGAAMFWRALVGGELPARVIELLDRILLILMIAEILYTVQVSLREHSLVPEPFLVVALIAGVRRVLIITAEFADLLEKGPEAFRNAMIELALLTAMIVALVASLMLLRRRTTQPEAKRA
jgi:uncharacterized membrane protein (DUF373 family)